MLLKAKYRCVLDYFATQMPDPETELNYNSPYELTVAVILSAQCTDKRVNLITPDLFEKFPGFAELSNASYEDVFYCIQSCSYPNNKTRHLINMAKKVVESFNGVLPSDVESLQTIPGIGRKTANVLLSVLFNMPSMAVDTHVFRVSKRIGLTRNASNVLQVEKELVKNIPEELIPKAHHWLILHGRYVCKARNPGCNECGISKCCDFFCSKISTNGSSQHN